MINYHYIETPKCHPDPLPLDISRVTGAQNHYRPTPEAVSLSLPAQINESASDMSYTQSLSTNFK